jgi:hypothetical protein
MAHPNLAAHTENGRYFLFNGHEPNDTRRYFHTNPLKNRLKDRMMKREYTITNPRTRRMKDENQASGKTLVGLSQIQFTKKIRS